jgi:simple sugar transport system permease protein
MDFIALILSSTIAYGVSLLLVALGGMFSERSGIINIALEGIMIFGGMFGSIFLSLVASSSFAQNAPQLAVLIGMLIAAVSGGLLSMLLGYAAIRLKADQTISGTALNIFAPAFAVVLVWAIQGQGLTDIPLPRFINLNAASFGIDAASLPTWLNTLFFKKMFLTIPVAFLILVASAIVLYKTPFGLRLRACGEHPQAADSVGVNVKKMRYSGVIISGVLSGIGGYAFVMVSSNSTFTANVAGYGFLALAVMIFGNWKPISIMGAAFFFAFFKTVSALALDERMAFLPKFGLANPEYLYNILPYVITMLVLAFTSKKSRAPKAEGIPYDVGKR